MCLKEFIAAITAMLEERFGSDYTFEKKEILKNNGRKLHGLTVRKEVNIAPTIYLDDLFRDYERGDSLDKIADKAEQDIKNAFVDNDIDISFLRSWEKMKDRIVFKLINTERNEEFLKEVPFVKFHDLSAVFYTIVSEDAFGSGTITIRNEQFEDLGVSVEEMFMCAMKNTPILLGTCFQSMEKVLFDILSEKNLDLSDFHLEENEEPSRMYVLTNRAKTLGAACMLDPESLRCITEKISSDIFILPSSIHELIIVPKSVGITAEELAKMVREVNSTQVSDYDFLSDNVYEFSIAEGVQIAF